ncbi:UNKNOWN [Stylonychia lemnae]|uniref:Transmembrane protein n=1 Tax=Stylonychia lemnae TaxID=5949 RepID=A0A078AD88_STYLE|nr:UNKNOWN [Stylonychia lemnae]|eukprot:CDW79806.1 UNKNOWN [Stylonychia lemnae]
MFTGNRNPPYNPQAQNNRQIHLGEPEKPIFSSLLQLQSLLYFDVYFSLILLIIMFCFYLFKLFALPYPQGQWEMEMIFLITYSFLQYARIESGRRGNRIESWGGIVFMIFLTAFSIFANGFFIGLQTYVLNLEVVLHSIAIGFAGLETLLGIICIIMFIRIDGKPKE